MYRLYIDATKKVTQPFHIYYFCQNLNLFPPFIYMNQHGFDQWKINEIVSINIFNIC